MDFEKEITNLKERINKLEKNAKKKNVKGKSKKKRAVLQFTKNGDYLAKWESGTKAGRELNISRATISLCCSRKQKQAGGFRWYFEDEMRHKKVIYQFSGGILIGQFKNTKDAADNNNCSEEGVIRAIKTGNKYANCIWQIGYKL